MPEENQVTCQMCGETFGSQDELKKHNKEAHGMDEGEK
jgi:hypothetical protein